MDKVAGSGNDEFYTPKYAIEPLLKYISGGQLYGVLLIRSNHYMCLNQKSMDAKLSQHISITDKISFIWIYLIAIILFQTHPTLAKVKCCNGFLILANPLLCWLVSLDYLNHKDDLICSRIINLRLCILADEFHISSPTMMPNLL